MEPKNITECNILIAELKRRLARPRVGTHPNMAVVYCQRIFNLERWCREVSELIAVTKINYQRRYREVTMLTSESVRIMQCRLPSMVSDKLIEASDQLAMRKEEIEILRLGPMDKELQKKEDLLRILEKNVSLLKKADRQIMGCGDRWSGEVIDHPDHWSDSEIGYSLNIPEELKARIFESFNSVDNALY